jgi:CubicO group peptidase (beta-lactamase class C family)
MAVKVDKLFAEWNKPDSPGCALAVVQDGKVVYQKGYGVANLDYGTPIKPNTVFHVASVSKQFTTFCIQLLVKEGTLSLADDVRKYLPELHDFGKKITIAHLIYHTSGLRDQWDLLALAGWRFDDLITEQDILDLVWRQRQLNFEPGAEYAYCNTGYTLLAVIVKRLSGKSLQEFAQERIFTPLGMTSTRFQEDYRNPVKQRAYSYEPGENGAFRYSALSFSNVGATSLFTTAEDLAKWDRNFYDAAVGGSDVVALMHVPGKRNNGKTIAYASGLILGAYRGLKTVEHAGADAGYRSVLLRFPEERFSVIVLANLGTFNPPGVARQVADLYLEERFKPAEPAVPAPEIKTAPIAGKLLDACAGEYAFGREYTRTFRRDGDTLVLVNSGQQPIPLVPVSDTEFSVKDLPTRYRFVRAKRGKKVEKVLRLNPDDDERTGDRIEPLSQKGKKRPDFTGDYYSEELAALTTVRRKGGKFFLDARKQTVELTAFLRDDFKSDIGRIHFLRDGKRITGYTVTTGRVRDLHFDRVQLKGASKKGDPMRVFGGAPSKK